ncbi:MarR family winged helix-turn-helix transcriptional regulator [Micromonospora sp. NPDC049559]|uniref:MarR family winged helix-turn-helix transcriptional regulator n=1 Tax=Micromonospora sp. NPDC049559 TaxID=3155923 RepID=UPI003435E392
MNLPADDAANLLGALALAVGERMRAAVTGPAGHGGTLAEAVVVLKDQPGVTAEWLGRVLEISQPGTAHLVRRLLALGWVERRAGADARSRALHLTPDGTAAAARILAARQRALAELLEPLDAEQRDRLAEITRAVLRPRARDERSLARLCRLCDRSRCARCPVHAGYLDHRPD